MLRSEIILLTATMVCISQVRGTEQWSVDTTQDWLLTERESTGLRYDKGFALPDSDNGSYLSMVRTFETKRSAVYIQFKQSSVWHNWNPVSNLGPSNLQDAPVTLALGQDNYWIFGRYGDAGRRNGQGGIKEKHGTDRALQETC